MKKERDPSMPKIRITVLKRTLNPELAKEYCQGDVAPCPCFTEGQEFVCSLDKPEGFCDWAWRDIHPMVSCCSDGIRPGVFRIERIDP